MKPIDWLKQLNEWCDEFEQGWRSGATPRIEDFLARALPESRPELLLDLLTLELVYRRKRGEAPNVSEYVVRFPAEARVVALAFSADRNSDSRARVNGRSTNGHPTPSSGRSLLPFARENTPAPSQPAGQVAHAPRRRRLTATALLAGLAVALAVFATVDLVRSRNPGDGNRGLPQMNAERMHEAGEAPQSGQGDERQALLAAQRRDDAERNEQIARDQQTRAELKEQQAEDQRYALEIAQAAAALQAGQPEIRSELLNHWIPKSGAPDRRGFEWWYLNRPTGTGARPLLAVAGGVSRLCGSPDHETIAVVGQDAIIRLLNLREGTVQKLIATGQRAVHGAAFSPRGQSLATAGEDGTVRLWNLATAAEIWRVKPLSGRPLQLAFTPDGEVLLCRGDDPNIHLLDAQSGKSQGLVEGAGGESCKIALSPDGKLLASAGRDEVLRLWDLPSKTRLVEYPLQRAADCLVLDGAHDLIFIGSADGSIETLRMDRAKGAVRGVDAITRIGNLERARSLALAPGGGWLVSGGMSGAISVWPTENGNLEPGARQSWFAHRGSVQSLLFSPDGSQLISAGGDGQVTSWSLESAVHDEPRQFRTDFQHRFSLIPGTPLMVGVHAPPRTLILWDWKRGRHTSVVGYMPFEEVASSPDGKFFAVIRRRHEVLTYPVPRDGVYQKSPVSDGCWEPKLWIEQVKVSPDSQTVAAVFRQNEMAMPGDPAGVILLKRPGLEVARTMTFPGAHRVAFAPSGNRLAVSSATTLALFDARGAVWSWPQAATDVLEFSPDGRLIASAGSEPAVWIRSAASGQLIQSLTTSTGPIRTVAFSPDGKTLATGGYDGSIALWHVPSLRELFKLRGPGGSCVRLEFSSDSRHLVSLIHTHPIVFGLMLTFNALEDDKTP